MYTSFVSLVRRCRCYQTDCSWEEAEVAEDEEEDEKSLLLTSNMRKMQEGGEKSILGKKAQDRTRMKSGNERELLKSDGIFAIWNLLQCSSRKSRMAGNAIPREQCVDTIEKSEERKSKNVGVPDSYERGKLREVEGQPATDCNNLKLSR